jgi:hypothetical protein
VVLIFSMISSTFNVYNFSQLSGPPLREGHATFESPTHILHPFHYVECRILLSVMSSEFFVFDYVKKNWKFRFEQATERYLTRIRIYMPQRDSWQGFEYICLVQINNKSIVAFGSHFVLIYFVSHFSPIFSNVL